MLLLVLVRNRQSDNSGTLVAFIESGVRTRRGRTHRETIDNVYNNIELSAKYTKGPMSF
jgi:hypothetical protein